MRVPGPLFRQPCNRWLQALLHLAGTFEGKTMQKAFKWNLNVYEAMS